MDRDSQPCVWMTAGLLRYRLCDRDFDCDHCPLDAALRGAPFPNGTPSEAAAASALRNGRSETVVSPVTFPGERRYSEGHTWAGPVPAGAGGRIRVGLDAFAGALLGVPLELCPGEGADTLSRGDPLCDVILEAGPLSLGSPVAGRRLSPNPTLAADPGLMTADPYGEGWLLEMAVEDDALEGLLEPQEARQRAGHDLRHFRRRIALHVLAVDGSGDEVGSTLPDGGELVTDLRALLGPRLYLDLLRELVH